MTVYYHRAARRKTGVHQAGSCNSVAKAQETVYSLCFSAVGRLAESASRPAAVIEKKTSENVTLNDDEHTAAKII